jgi:hypothetical protein
MRRHTTQPSIALGRQLAEWREPLDEDPAVEEAVLRMLKSLDRYLEREPHPKEYETCR